MKYDDATWHSGGKFPKDSPPKYGGTHIALLLRWCLLKGWAGEQHLRESTEDLQQLLSDEMTGTEFLFRNCDGKFTDEDLNDEGNAFIVTYYGNDGPYLSDYAEAFGDLMYVAGEKEHDYKKFSQIVNRRYSAHIGGKKPWWRPW